MTTMKRKKHSGASFNLNVKIFHSRESGVLCYLFRQMQVAINKIQVNTGQVHALGMSSLVMVAFDRGQRRSES